MVELLNDKEIAAIKAIYVIGYDEITHEAIFNWHNIWKSRLKELSDEDFDFLWERAQAENKTPGDIINDLVDKEIACHDAANR